MTLPARWICPTCHSEVAAPFCPGCGEKPLHPHDLTLRRLLSQAVTTLTSVDGRVLRSFRSLMFRPGALTMAFLEGRRKPYIAALPLFLLTNVLFFATQSLSPEKVFSTTLHSHMYQQDWAMLAQRLVARRLEATNKSLEVFAPLFDQAVALNSKSLVILMALPLLLLLPVAFRRSARPFAVHVVFALHVCAFQLVFLCLQLALISIAGWLHATAFTTLLADRMLFGVYLAACAAYMYAALPSVYGASGWTRVLQTLLLTTMAGLAVVGYRFVVFVITLYGT